MGLSLLTAYPGLYPVCVSCGNPCALGWKSSKLSTAYHPQGTGYKMGTLPAELVTMQDDWSTLRIMMEKRESIQPETLGGKVCGTPDAWVGAVHRRDSRLHRLRRICRKARLLDNRISIKLYGSFCQQPEHSLGRAFNDNQGHLCSQARCYWHPPRICDAN
jgi:hypothetical protein